MQALMKPLSRKQAQVLNFIKLYIKQNGYSPTIREIGEGVGLTATSGVHGHLDRLERNGHIKREPYNNRAISVVDHEKSASEVKFFDERMQQIMQKVHEATPGPWMYSKSTCFHVVRAPKPNDTYRKDPILCRMDAISGVAQMKKDAEFIANARSDVMYLLNKIHGLEAEVAQLIKESMPRI